MGEQKNYIGNMIPAPNIAIMGETLRSDICIWCGEKNDLTKSHLIPESLGGWFKPRISCRKCNSILGHAFEAEAFKNAFLTAAISKFGISAKKDVYRLAKITDTETGAPMSIGKDGRARPIPGKVGKSAFRGDFATDAKRYWRSWFANNRPNWPFEPMAEFLEDPASVVRRNYLDI